MESNEGEREEKSEIWMKEVREREREKKKKVMEDKKEKGVKE